MAYRTSRRYGMRSLIAMAAVMSALPVTAQTQLLTGRVSQDNIDWTDWVYNALNKVTEIHNTDMSHPEWNSIRLITWNEKGLQTGENLYQDIDKVGSGDYNDYRWNGILEFVYNDKDQIAERIVLNNIAPRGEEETDFQFSGIIVYTYDEEGRMTEASTYFDRDKTNLYQTVEYEYDELGLLRKSETYMLDFITNELKVSNRDTYTYNSDGRLLRVSSDVADFYTGEFFYSGSTVYSYSEDGRLLSKEMLGSSDSVISKYVFNYPESPLAAEEVVFPYNIDDTADNELWRQMGSMPSSYDDWATDQNTDALTKVATYDYVLTPITGVGVGSIESGDERRGPVVMSFADGRLRLGNVADGTMVNVFATDGRCMSQGRYHHDGIDMPTLPSGIYVISTPAGAVKVFK